MTIIVAGLGRCGSSLVMQMLAAAGVKCAGEPPLYEHEDTVQGAHLSAAWFAQFGAVKLLMPTLYNIDRAADISFVWMDRNPAEQSRSQIKYMRGVVPDIYAGVPEPRLLEIYRAELARFRRESLAVVDRFPHIYATFEEALRDPKRIAGRFGLDRDAMASVIVPRSPACRPDMAIEMTGAV